VRLGKAADLLVREEVRRLGRSRSSVVEELTEEAAKTRLFPGVAFRGNPRRAWAIGTGLDLWEILRLDESFAEDATAFRRAHPKVTAKHIRLARTYSERFPDDLSPFLEAGDRPLAEFLALYPFFEPPR
jgi:hypothetical protein